MEEVFSGGEDADDVRSESMRETVNMLTDIYIGSGMVWQIEASAREVWAESDTGAYGEEEVSG